MAKKSATLVMNELMFDKQSKGERVVNLGFGEAGLPVLPSLTKIAAEHLPQNSYPYVQGGAQVRKSISGYFRRRGIASDSELCLTAPGSKAIIYALLLAIQGDLILSRPSWTSYGMQAQLMGKKVVWVDTPEVAGGIPDPSLLQQAIDTDRAEGGNPRILLITNPDNPSGTVSPADALSKLATIAKNNDLTIISDEIYRDLAYDQKQYVSIAELAPERTIVTTGMSKSLALGGWRVGAATFPKNDLGQRLYDSVVGSASEIWSGMAIFLEPVAEYAFAEPQDVRQRVAQSRILHQKVSHAIYEIFEAAGAKVREPNGAFYMYPTFRNTEIAERFGVTDDRQLSSLLLAEKGIATLPGRAFGDKPERMGLRVVTSMVYGTNDEERETTLHSQDPVNEPSVRQALDHVREVLL
ncbi:MAG: pyridoxal phosphate-dependent aminotransferase [Bifidobacterium sp.]|uniref:pyridoxal phosphate-dependent aminotransferase n=1 Tax=Bifidobacterium sp. TaxID=41200 RepID=UPI0039EC6113